MDLLRAPFALFPFLLFAAVLLWLSHGPDVPDLEPMEEVEFAEEPTAQRPPQATVDVPGVAGLQPRGRQQPEISWMDPATPAAERRRRAFQLAEENPLRAAEELKRILSHPGSGFLNAALAEGLGRSEDPGLVELVNGLTRHEDEMLARGAVRGIGARGSPEAAGLLGSIARDWELGESVRTEAILMLGEMEEPSALDELLRASYEAMDLDEENEPVFQAVLEALGRSEDERSLGFLSRLLAHPEVEPRHRVAALDVLDAGEEGVAPLLIRAAGHPEEDVREAAVWALDGQPDLHPFEVELLELLQREENPELRERLRRLLSSSAQPGS